MEYKQETENFLQSQRRREVPWWRDGSLSTNPLAHSGNTKDPSPFSLMWPWSPARTWAAWGRTRWAPRCPPTTLRGWGRPCQDSHPTSGCRCRCPRCTLRARAPWGWRPCPCQGWAQWAAWPAKASFLPPATPAHPPLTPVSEASSFLKTC